MVDVVNVPNDPPKIFQDKPVIVRRKYETCHSAVYLATTGTPRTDDILWVIGTVSPNGEVRSQTEEDYHKSVKAFETAIAEVNRALYIF